jgi:hypothetical protein
LSLPKNYREEVAMEKIDYFDYKRLARKMKVPNTILKRIEREVKKEFPSDKMLYELHVLRAVRSKYWQTKKEKQKGDDSIFTMES